MISVSLPDGVPCVIIIRVMAAYARLLALEAFGRHYAKSFQCISKNQSSHAVRKLALLKQFERRDLIFTRYKESLSLGLIMLPRTASLLPSCHGCFITHRKILVAWGIQRMRSQGECDQCVAPGWGFPCVIIIRVMGAYARLCALESFGRSFAKRLQCAGKNQSSHAVRKLALLKQFERRDLIFTRYKESLSLGLIMLTRAVSLHILPADRSSHLEKIWSLGEFRG